MQPPRVRRPPPGPGAGATDPNRPRSIRRNAALAFAAQLIGAAFTAFITVFMAHRLGSGGFGILSLALGLSGLAMLPADFGVSISVARFVAEHRGVPGRVAAVLADGLRLKAIGAFVVAAGLAAGAGAIASAYGIPGLVWPIRGVALALLGEGVMTIGGVFAALGRVDLQLKTALTESVVEASTAVGLVLAGLGATGAAFGRAAGYLAGSAATLLVLVRLLGPRVLPKGLKFGPDARRIASYAGVLLIVDGAYTTFSQIDVLIIGAYGGASAAGLFSAPMRLITFLAYPGGAVAAGVAPRLAHRAGARPAADSFVRGLRFLVIVQALITAFVLGWADLVVQITLGDQFRESATVLRALAPYVFLLGFGTLVSISVNYLGEARRRIPVALVTVIINVGVDLLLVPGMGATGGAVGTDLAYAVYAPAHLYICWRALGVDLRPALRTLASATLAGGVLTGVLLLFGDTLSRAGMTAIGGLTGLIAFGLILWLTGEIDPREIRASLWALPLRGRPAAADRSG